MPIKDGEKDSDKTRNKFLALVSQNLESAPKYPYSCFGNLMSLRADRKATEVYHKVNGRVIVNNKVFRVNSEADINTTK